VDHSLHRSKADWEDLDVPKGLAYLAEQVWEDLLLLADDASSGDVLARLDGYREEYESFYRHAEHVAQSSIMATRSLHRGEKRSDPAKNVPKQPAAQPLVERLVLRARRVVPAEVRARIPLRVKRAVVEMLR
jgi:hypothetical protein